MRDEEKVKLWFCGPERLRKPEAAWRQEEPVFLVEEGDVEVKVEKKVNLVEVRNQSVLEVLEERVSSWQRMKRIMVWIDRFVKRCRKKEGEGHPPHHLSGSLEPTRSPNWAEMGRIAGGPRSLPKWVARANSEP